MTKELITVPKDIKKIPIKNDNDMKKATEMLSRANKYLDNLKLEKEKLTKPLNQALKEIRSRYKPAEEQLEKVVKMTREEMTSYQTAKIDAQKIEEKRIADQVSKGKIDMSTALEKVEAMPKPIVAIGTMSGSVSFRPVRCFKIKDHKKIPAEYLILNETMVRNNSNDIPGIEYWIEQRPINKR